MGGLVVKEAYLLGQNDEEYKGVIRAVSGILFLATPHRGTRLAIVLKRVLMASSQSRKSFIADLSSHSSAVEDINEQFRHVAVRLSMESFYETLATPVGPKKVLVLEKDSSILGYPDEISRALDADHHGVCKFDNPEDSNYISVCNALKTLIRRFSSEPSEVELSLDSNQTEGAQQLIAVASDTEDDYYYRRSWMPGTCDWLLREPEMQSWLDESAHTHVL